MGVSQPARFGEDWSDERVKSYLNQLPPAGENADFHALMTAYKHMRAGDFERFVVFFQAAGRDIKACDREGKTLLERIRTHSRSIDFAHILERAGS